jgi:hypothetical protein
VTTFSVLAVGFLLGLKHATETDHLTAVATLATKQWSLRQIVRQGIAWGLGHSLMLLGIGSLVLALGQAIPAWLAQALECAVGVMLVVLGADALRRVLIDRKHVLSQGHVRSAHEHMSGPPLRALVVGMVHGMAGSAALIVLSLGAMQSPGRALLYIVTFGIGSIAGMAVLSAVMSGPLRLSAKWLGEGHQIVMGLIGAFSCAVGVIVVCRMGILD